MSEPLAVSEPLASNGSVVKDNEDAEALKEQPIAKKQKTLTSAVWKDFERVEKNGKMMAICKHCKKELQGGSSSGTSHLKNHILKVCKKKLKPDIRQQLLNVKNKNGVGNVEAFKFDADRSRKDFAHMVILHELPFAFANYAGVREFVKNLQPLFAIKGRKTVKADCLKVYEERKVKMYEMLEGIDSRLSLTSDMWTSCQNYGYMSLTAHFIDKDLKLRKIILNFLKVEVPHNAEKLSETIMSCLMEWNVDRKLFAISLDNCSTNDSMVKKIRDQLNERELLLGDGKFFHIRCAAHILNLIVQDGWRVLSCDPKGGTVVEKIRETVKFIINSPKKQAIFDKVAKEVHIQSEKSLVRDCTTRWNSTYEMLNVALVYKEAFSRLQFKDKDYKFALTKEEWEMAKATSNCLKIFHDVTHMLSGTKFPTSNIFFYHICEINISILKWEKNPNEFISTMANSMRIKFNKYWRICHSSLAIASILDPQYKMKLLEYYFPKIYEESEATFQIAGIKGVLNACIMILPRTSKFDILAWWKVNEAKYPILSQMARDVLGIPVSTVPSESVFSTSGRVIDKYRSNLDPTTVQALICAQDWLRDDFSAPEHALLADHLETPYNESVHMEEVVDLEDSS